MKVFNKEETRKIIYTALETAYNSVAHTLGPKGSNVVTMIDGKSTVTNDGVSIIRQLTMDSEYNIPLDIIKQACFNAENKSGDGTTTAIVLTKAIYDEAIKLVEKNKVNEIVLRDKIFELYKEIENYILERKTPIKNIEDIKGVATVSLGGNKKIANKIAKAFEMVNMSGKIEYRIDDTSEDIKLEKIDGYIINSDYLGYVQNYFGEIDNALIMIYSGSINNANDIKSLAMAMREENNKRPVILMSNFNQEALNIIFQYNNVGTRIIPYSLPSFGIDRESSIMEISYLTKGSILDKNTPFSEYDFEETSLDETCGNAKKVILKNNTIILTDIEEERYNTVLNNLKEKNPDRYEKIKNGICNILIGGKTLTEAEETMMRIEDAVNSIKLAIKSGIVIGGANLLYKISTYIDSNKDELYGLNKDEFKNVLCSALKRPLEIIMETAENKEKVKEKMKEINYYDNIGFDSNNENFTDLLDARIIDPAETVINSLKSAVSIATSLLTINCIINNKGE